jgi:hypothetical protein
MMCHSAMQAADFFGDTEAYSTAVRELAQTLYPSLHACLDGHSDTLDYPTGLCSKIQTAMTRAFHAEHGISPISQVCVLLSNVINFQAYVHNMAQTTDVMHALQRPSKKFPCIGMCY